MTRYIHVLLKLQNPFSWGHNQTPKGASTCRESPRSCTTCKNQRELLTSGVVFDDARYKYFIENKNVIKTFWGCKQLQKKRTLSLIKVLSVLLKNALRHWMNFKIQRVVNVKREKVKLILAKIIQSTLD